MATRRENAIAPNDNSDMPQTHQMSDSTSDIFPFFDLPREMRDEIYGGIECKEIKNPFAFESSAYDATIHEYPVRSCLQVSKQFQSEYLDSMKGRPRLLLEDSGRDYRVITLPVALQFVARCDITMVIDDTLDTSGHLDCVQSLMLGLNKSCKWNIKIILDGQLSAQYAASEPERVAATASLIELVFLQQLSQVRVYRTAPGMSLFPMHLAHPTLGQAPVFGWTATEGWCSPALAIFGNALQVAQPSASDGKAGKT